MSPVEIALLLFVAGLALLAADLFIPSHGILSLLGLVCIAGGIATCFAIGRYVGLTALLLSVAAAPVGAYAFVKIWPRTWIGRRLCLPEANPSALDAVPVVGVLVGDVGQTVTELRPMGEADFRDTRLEVKSETGIIPARAKIKVVAITGRTPVVRIV